MHAHPARTMTKIEYGRQIQWSNVPHAAERQNIQFPTEMEQLAIWYRMPTRQNKNNIFSKYSAIASKGCDNRQKNTYSRDLHAFLRVMDRGMVHGDQAGAVYV